MMYVIDASCISPQVEEGIYSDNIKEYKSDMYHSIEPSYRDIIPKSILRRMGKGVKMGVVNGLPLLKEYSDIKAIIVATSSNGLNDSGKFLDQLIEYDEGRLTPTNFVQSMPNSLAGQLALLSDNPCYNTSHVHIGNAFENALIDAFLQLQQNNIAKILVGDVEEISDYNYRFNSKRNRFKSEPVSNKDLIKSATKGTVSGEGSSMFVLSNNAEGAIAKIVDVRSLFKAQKSVLREQCLDFLSVNSIKLNEIDLLVLGYNGNQEEDHYYDFLSDLFPSATNISYKHLVGEYSTSTAFAMYLSIRLLSGKKLANNLILKDANRNVKKVLIYNQYQQLHHNFILLEQSKD